MCCQGKPHYLTFRQGWKLTHLWYVQFNFCTVFVHHAPRVSNSCNSFPPTLLTKLAGMSLGHLVMSTYKILFFLLKLMFRLRACTEEIAYFALFAEALPQTATCGCFGWSWEGETSKPWIRTANSRTLLSVQLLSFLDAFYILFLFQASSSAEMWGK